MRMEVALGIGVGKAWRTSCRRRRVSGGPGGKEGESFSRENSLRLEQGFSTSALWILGLRQASPVLWGLLLPTYMPG